MSKKILSLTLALVLALAMFTLPAFAADPNSVYLAGNTQTVSNTMSGTAGGTAPPTQPPETTLPPSGNTSKLVGHWYWNQIKSGSRVNYWHFLLR